MAGMSPEFMYIMMQQLEVLDWNPLTGLFRERLPLTCETCGGTGNKCNGPFAVCPPAEDRCGTILLEGTETLTLRSIVKTCVQSKSCNEPFTSVNLGKAGEVRAHLTCCVGEECQKTYPIMPNSNLTPNGKSCPACYTTYSFVCEEETIQCTGDQFYCLETSGIVTLGGELVPFIMKGCANEAYCDNMQDHPLFGGIQNVITANCTKSSGMTQAVPGLFGLFLHAFVGLFLAKMLG